MFGVGGALYTLGAFVRVLLETDWPEMRRRRQVEQSLALLRDHIIIAGYGRVGRRLAAVLRREGQALVVVDLRATSSTEPKPTETWPSWATPPTTRYATRWHHAGAGSDLRG